VSVTIGTRGAAETWFRRVLWIGIVANLALAIPTLLAPARLIAMSGFPEATPLLWPRFSALLLVLLSLFYMPAGVDPNRYRPVAWLAVGSRLAGVIFFLVFQAAEYRMLGYFDLAFLIPELPLLLMLPPVPAWPAAMPAGGGR
jgi:hypothetical protein